MGVPNDVEISNAKLFSQDFNAKCKVMGVPNDEEISNAKLFSQDFNAKHKFHLFD